MKALFPLFVCLLFACTENIEAIGEGNGEYGFEQISKDAIFYDTIAGREIFEIKEGLELTSLELESDWIIGEIVLSISKENYETSYLKAGDFLRNVEKENIGKVLSDFPIWKKGVLDGDSIGVIRAYSRKQNLLTSSIIERSLEESIKSSQTNLDDFEEFIVENRLKYGEIFPGFQNYYQWENKMIKPSPGYRLILIFSGQSLQGIVHGRKMDLPSFDQRETVQGTYFSFPPLLKNEKKESFLRAFEELHPE